MILSGSIRFWRKIRHLKWKARKTEVYRKVKKKEKIGK